MPADLLTVTENAKQFLVKSGYLFTMLEKAELDENKEQWRLTFNVAITEPKLKTVIIESSTGRVVGFE